MMSDGNPCGYMHCAKSGEKYCFWDLADLTTQKRALLWTANMDQRFENESGQLLANFNIEFPCSISL